jgi:ribosomal protein S18 acetylase RimI-like enzyme
MSALRLVSPTDPAVAPLLAGLRREYSELYGADVATELDRYAPIEFLPPTGAFLVVADGGLTVAGGALRHLGRGYGEIKRMWTDPRFRGRGHARRILGELERAALRRGYHAVRLETGSPQKAAVALYESAGYERIAPYGHHGHDPRCLSFEKRLDGRDHLAADALDRGEVVVRQMLQHHALHARHLEAA